MGGWQRTHGAMSEAMSNWRNVTRPIPVPNALTQPFWDAAKQGVLALQRLDAVSQALQRLPSQVQPSSPVAPVARPWWQAGIAAFVDITPSRLQGPLTAGERASAEQALELELTLARAAIERGDGRGRDAALARVDQWAQRRWPDSPGLRAQHAELQALRKAPLQAESSVLGSTLQQLRSQTDRR